MRIVLSIIILILTNSLAFAAGDKWDTLPDGRVVIEVFGQRLAFDPKDTDIVNDRVYGGREGDPPVYFAKAASAKPEDYLSLKQVIEDKPRAEAFFEQAKKTKWNLQGVELVFIMQRGLPPLKQYDGQFLGIFPYDEVDGNFGLMFRNHYNASGGTSNRNPESLDPWLSKTSGPDENGVMEYYTTEIKFYPKIPPSNTVLDAEFIMPAAKRLTEAQYDLHIHYSMLSRFAFGLSTADELIQFGYHWDDGASYQEVQQRRKLDKTEQYFVAHFSHFQQKDWPRLDEMARNIAADIFIDRKPEDFQ